MSHEAKRMPGVIDKVGVVGAGIMGRGITHVALLSGVQVQLVDNLRTALDSAVTELDADFASMIRKGKLTEAERAAALDLLSTSTELSDLADSDLVIEAVPERLELKLDVLAAVSQTVRPDAIIASNTSSIPITQLCQSIHDPSRFLGVHFFNPVPRMGLVEVIRTVLTDPCLEGELHGFVKERLGKDPIAVADRPGFVVNALLVPYLLSAARMVDTGYASAENIDNAMRLGAGHPMGPLALSDLIGLDTVCQVADALHAETRDPSTVVPNNLRRLVEAGRIGRKSGQGFHQYTSPR